MYFSYNLLLSNKGFT